MHEDRDLFAREVARLAEIVRRREALGPARAAPRPADPPLSDPLPEGVAPGAPLAAVIGDAVAAAKADPADAALRSLSRDLGWLLLMRGGTQLMAQVLIAAARQVPAAAATVDAWWAGIGDGDDIWGALPPLMR